MVQKPSIPKGTRDFGPEVMAKRNLIIDTIKSVFKRYGYQPIETPALENLSTLLGKYGDEGDKLLFKILNSGDFMSGVQHTGGLDAASLAPQISDKGLRYDLTVPFARFVVQYRNEINFPFKRYQIQPVWRADRPQKGRYREFYQCDVDVIGSDSLLNEAELVQITDDVFIQLGIKTIVKINNRKILAGIAEYIGHPQSLIPITIAIDKLDKTSIDEVNRELLLNGISQDAVDLLQPVLFMKGSSLEKFDQLDQLLAQSEIGKKGIEEMRNLFRYLDHMQITLAYELDLTLARGLNYYTGAILEVKALDIPMGSICGGGRYDDLTGIFGMQGVSGVGISFGADRIYDVMSTLGLFPESACASTTVLFANFGDTEAMYCLPLLKQLREAGMNAEIFPEAVKMKKQLKYADQKGISIVIIAGEKEVESNTVTVKWMKTGEQRSIPKSRMLEHISSSD